ncbi:MAG TPA: cation-translocating P-type ATPase, partial [Syntrophorhabdaceae bacterium]|nr:cation-translocating P-type ATPase [Syntrophorhabdaceae bacterium]
ADMRLMEAVQLKVEEAALTGESVPVEKDISAIKDGDVSLADRLNMAYKGTIVSYGRGRGIVVATGMKTELGKIASMLQGEQDVKTPLQKRLTAFGRRLALAVIVICAIVFAMGVFRGEPSMLMLLTAISLAVAAIPEALPAVITISLALGAKKMVRQNALVKKLPAVETLGSVTYICSDKTGTLTVNRMSVEEIWAGGRIIHMNDKPAAGELDDLFSGLALSNDARVSGEGKVIGDPTEIALFEAAAKFGYQKNELEKRYPRVSELPFDSERKAMTTLHRAQGTIVSFTKGAAEVLIDSCQSLSTPDGSKPVNKEELMKLSDEMAGRGLRVLCLAMRRWNELPAVQTSETIERDLVLLGLIGMMDPPRPEAADAVALAKTAGIRPVMITGDHPATARAIARRVGILEDNGEAAVMTGRQLEQLSLEEYENIVERIQVYARVAPEQKLKLVRALQDRGHFVAMTGDGVNDAPALKRANIGIAMGITGTDVSKEAAHMILLDDNFATIVKAVKEGRRIFDNIRKFIKYTMTSNSGEIWSIFLAPFFGLPVPLLPIHILWINLVTDGLPGLAMSVEPAEKGVMEKPPRHPNESIFAHGLAYHLLWVGLLMGGLVLGAQALSLKLNLETWQTIVFNVLCLSQLGHALAIRSETESLFSQGLFSNKPLFGSIVFTVGLQMMVTYVPFLNPIFRTRQLNASELLFVFAVSSLVFLAVEIEKLLKRHFRKT